MAHPTPSRRRLPKQSGVTLIVVLLFLLALTAVAVFASRQATLGEQQARNEMAYQMARQAAETALRDAERDLSLDGSVKPTDALCQRNGALRSEDSVISEEEFTSTCLRGQCQLDKARYKVDWEAATAATAATATTAATAGNPGEPWWPVSKGGLWGDNSSLTSTQCATFTGAVPLGTFTGAPRLNGVVRQPEYLIEVLGPEQDTGHEQKGFECPNPVATGQAGIATADATTTTVAAQTLKMPCHLFRITARGFGPTLDAEVVMQTYFHIIKS